MNKLGNGNRTSLNVSRNLKNRVTNKISNVAETGKQIGNTLKTQFEGVTEKVKNAVQSTTDKIHTFAAWDSLKDRTSQFAESNTAISKFIFIILLLIAFLFLFNVGSSMIQTLIGATRDPILLDGMVSAKKTTKISVNPNESGSVPIYRSVNEDQGMEFTWNIWFFIDGLNTNNPSYSRIFSKGSENNNLSLKMPSSCADTSCRNIFNSSPGLFITQKKQTDSVFPNTTSPVITPQNVNMILMMNTFKPSSKSSQFSESITIENIPMQKWVCATIRVQQTTVDIYINGIMTQRKKLNNLPRQNYYDVKVGDSNDGFDGTISSLRYFSKALGYDEIQSLYGKGPNLKSLDRNGLSSGGDYLSMNWYYKS